MPSPLHEVLVRIFRQRPSLALELAKGRREFSLPMFEKVEVLSGDMEQVSAPQHRADAVLMLTQGGAPVLALVLEVQLARKAEKLYSWPVYLAGIRARFRCRNPRPHWGDDAHAPPILRTASTKSSAPKTRNATCLR